MNCRELESFLYPYLDREFEPNERLEFEEHLARCHGCARKVHAQARMHEAVKRTAYLAGVAAPEGLRQRIHKGLTRQHRRANLVFWGQLAASVAVVVGAGSAYVAWKPGARVRFVEDAARSHAKALPLEIQKARPEDYEAWFAGKLDHRISVPQLPNATVAGARLSNVADKQAAYIAYDTPTGKDSSSRRIGLFVIDDTKRDIPADPLPSLNLDSSHGFNVAVWRDREIVYELLTDLDEDDIRQMLRAIPAPSRQHRIQPASIRR